MVSRNSPAFHQGKAQFDPAKYQDNSGSSGWSGSLHSNEAQFVSSAGTGGSARSSPADTHSSKPLFSTASDGSSHEGTDFSLQLQATRKVLSFHGEPSSSSDNLGNDSEDIEPFLPKKCSSGKSESRTQSRTSQASKSNPGKESSSSQRKIKDSVPPLSAVRLRPIRQRTRNAVVSIYDLGSVIFSICFAQ